MVDTADSNAGDPGSNHVRSKIFLHRITDFQMLNHGYYFLFGTAICTVTSFRLVSEMLNGLKLTISSCVIMLMLTFRLTQFLGVIF